MLRYLNRKEKSMLFAKTKMMEKGDAIDHHEKILRKRVNECSTWGYVKIYAPHLRQLLGEIRSLRKELEDEKAGKRYVSMS